jgi:FdhE protein
MAKLEREEGRRILQCSLCSTEWAFRRLQCPFCRNDDHDTLRFFFVDEESPYRVDVCDICKRYIKTVDERKLEEEKKVMLTLENIATLFLDILAVEEGYRNPHQHLFGIEEEPLTGSALKDSGNDPMMM